MCPALPLPSSTAPSPPRIETSLQMNGEFTRGNYRRREGGRPHVLPEGRGLSFSLSQRTLSSGGGII